MTFRTIKFFSNLRISLYNPYWNNKQASQKLPNLELAESLGLKIPKTLVTNNYEKAKEFGDNSLNIGFDEVAFWELEAINCLHLD